jgi:hypothetical protein
MQYLMNEGLLKYGGGGGPAGWVSLTHRGVVEVEATHNTPEQPTEHFPPHIVQINIGQMTRSIVQAGERSTASISGLEGELLNQLRNALAEVRRLYGDANPSSGVSSDRALKAVSDAETELTKSSPDWTKVVGALYGVGFAIQTVPALRPTYKLIGVAVKAISGLDLPEVPLP